MVLVLCCYSINGYDNHIFTVRTFAKLKTNMNVTVLFSELQSLVRQKTGREIVLSAVDGQTVKVEAKVEVKVPLLGKIEKNIGMNVSVEQIEGNDVRLKYDGGIGTDMLVGALLTFLASDPEAAKMMEKTPGNGIVVHLDEIKEARKVLDMVELTNIVFQEKSVIVEGRIR